MSDKTYPTDSGFSWDESRVTSKRPKHKSQRPKCDILCSIQHRSVKWTLYNPGIYTLSTASEKMDVKTSASIITIAYHDVSQWKRAIGHCVW